jgi:hypothetical protein
VGGLACLPTPTEHSVQSGQHEGWVAVCLMKAANLNLSAEGGSRNQATSEV